MLRIGWYLGLGGYIVFVLTALSKKTAFLQVSVPWSDSANIGILVVAATLLVFCGRPGFSSRGH